MNRRTARQFIHAVEWCLPRHLMYLFEGRYNSLKYGYYRKELVQMSKTKRVEPLKVIKGAVTAFCDPHSRKSRLAWIVDHDTKIRDVMAKWFYLYGGMEKAGYAENGADFKINDQLFLELDNGAMTESQLRDKIKKHYLAEGSYQVLFVMASMYGEENEVKRVGKLLKLAQQLLPTKPNRIIASGYSAWLKNGKAFNYKGKEIEFK